MKWIVIWTILEISLKCDRPNRCYDADLYQQKCSCKYVDGQSTLAMHSFENYDRAFELYDRALKESVYHREGLNIRNPMLCEVKMK